MTCPDENQLAEFIHGVLGQPEVAAMDAHIDDCVSCAELLASYARDPDRTAPESGDDAPSMPVASAIDGRYVFLEIVGTGAMGVVYAAYDRKLDRKVAIKVLRAQASESGSATERLHREAHAMARLSHPNVLPVYDVGTIADRVFIVMEFIDGSTIADWLEEPRPWQDVLEFFAQAGSGLAASHEAGFVHRDFKPGNLLVGPDGRIRIADFGLASRGEPPASEREGPASERLAITRTGELVGTPVYMAPELFDGLPADERSDQFSFCVALYEALYGRRPFPAKDLSELVEAVSAGKPLPPPAETDVPAWLHRAVVRGLDRDPAARHPSMATLLESLVPPPVRARGRVLVPLGVFVAVSVVGFAAYQRAISSTDRCQGREAQLAGIWDDGVKAAITEAFASDPRRHAKDTSALVADRLARYANRWVAMGIESCKETFERGSQSEQLLDRRTRCLDRRLGELAATTDLLARLPSPEVASNAVNLVDELTPLSRCADREALDAVVPLPDDDEERERVLSATVDLDRIKALARSGQYRLGLEQAAELTTRLEGLTHAPLEADLLLTIAKLENSASRAKDAEATMRRATSAAARAKDDGLVAQCWTRLAWIVGVEQARIDDGLRLVAVAETAVSRAGDRLSERAELMNVNGAILEAAGKLDEARAAFEAAIVIETEIGAPGLHDTLNNLGVVLHKQGNYVDARKRTERALELAEAALGREHPEIAKYLNNLGSILTNEGKLEDARAPLERALALREAGLRPNHGKTAESLTSLGTLLVELGENDEARKMLERAVTAAEASRGRAHPDVARVLSHLGNLHYGGGRLELAHEAHARSLAIYETAFGNDHVNVSYPLNTLGAIAQDQGKHSEAQSYYTRSFSIREKSLGKKHPHTASPLNNLGDLMLSRGEPAKALDHFKRALAIWRESLGDEHPQLAFALIGIGESQLRLGRARRALEPLERALAIRSKKKSKPLYLAEAQFPLARALWQTGARSRSLELATSARDNLESDKTARELFDDVEAWRRARQAP